MEAVILEHIMRLNSLLAKNAKAIKRTQKTIQDNISEEMTLVCQEGLVKLREHRSYYLQQRHMMATWLGIGDQYPSNPD